MLTMKERYISDQIPFNTTHCLVNVSFLAHRQVSKHNNVFFFCNTESVVELFVDFRGDVGVLVVDGRLQIRNGNYKRNLGFLQTHFDLSLEIRRDDQIHWSVLCPRSLPQLQIWQPQCV